MKTTSDKPAIRRANLQDANAIKQCIDRAYSPVKERLNDLPDVSAGVEKEISEKVVFVAENNTSLAGCVILALQGNHAHLVNIAVDPEYHGRGIARLLIHTAEELARRDGASEFRLATHVGMPENVALYTHLGWSETERKGNKVLMTKRLKGTIS
ncbi:GNAT family N-acetyltransferase [Labrenzia sp. PHM005]|uniref:GNAT family N-acetyltransferase n=1 Tax=Labrenzia sp. PHM005 TaxID=2590016 RepID=UPI00113FE61A|nr:GNAT family N-acetyltransferase [Labrenzia sp. PHM005]QDG78659.1 GNAT family N-acetyltransferase [Labrenzia sp. PHM005]